MSQSDNHQVDDQLPILQRRRIEAGVIAQIYEVLCREIGEERAADVIREAVTKDARAAGERFAAATPDGANLRTFIDIQELWTRDGALVTETTQATDEVFEFTVHQCAYAQMYREMGLAEIGPLLSCVRDYEFTAGYDPAITLTRSQTIMQGAKSCQFHYERQSHN